jgi:hypothetical protein
VERHPLDAVSAAMGVLIVGLGVLVAVDALDAVHAQGWWFALATLVVGLAIVPWRLPRRAAGPAGDVGPAADDEPLEPSTEPSSEPPVEPSADADT